MYYIQCTYILIVHQSKSARKLWLHDAAAASQRRPRKSINQVFVVVLPFFQSIAARECSSVLASPVQANTRPSYKLSRLQARQSHCVHVRLYHGVSRHKRVWAIFEGGAVSAAVKTACRTCCWRCSLAFFLWKTHAMWYACVCAFDGSFRRLSVRR